MRELYHTYRDNNRLAEVFKTPKGWEVDLHEVDDWLATKKVHNHSESYAENCAENWVSGQIRLTDIETTEKKEGSWYEGGNPYKDDNTYVKGLDD